MAEYEQRERNFNRSLPGIFANYTTGLVIADAEGKLKYLEFVQAIFETPNLTIDQRISIIKSETPLSIGLSVPAASVIDISPLGVESASLKMSMTVHASEVQEKSLDSQTDSEVEVTAGWGPVKVKAKIKASISTHSNHKRESDYTATTDAELKMTRQPVPETLAKIMDSFSEVAMEAMKINQQIITNEAAQASEEAEAAPIGETESTE